MKEIVIDRKDGNFIIYFRDYPNITHKRKRLWDVFNFIEEELKEAEKITISKDMFMSMLKTLKGINGAMASLTVKYHI